MHKNYSVSLGTKCLENLLLLINTQHYMYMYSLFQIAICRILQLHSYDGRSLTVRHYRCTCKSRNLVMRLCTCYAISGLATQSQDWNRISRLECNPRILRVRSTILRLHKILRLRGTNRAQVPPLFWHKYNINFICSQVHVLLECLVDKECNP